MPESALAGLLSRAATVLQAGILMSWPGPFLIAIIEECNCKAPTAKLLRRESKREEEEKKRAKMERCGEEMGITGDYKITV